MSAIIFKDTDMWFNRIDDYTTKTKEEMVAHMNELVQTKDANVLSSIASIMHPKYEINVNVVKIAEEKYLVLLTMGRDTLNSIIRSITAKTEFEYRTDVDFQHWTELVQDTYSALTEAQGNY